MKKSVISILITGIVGFSSPAYPFTVSKSTTGTSTETSTTSSGSTTAGSCVGDLTASKSTAGSRSTTSGCTTTPPDIDDDGDGMPSTWELTYALDKYSDTDARTDLDNDFISNLVEYLRGLIPNNNDSDGDTVKDGDDVDPLNASSGSMTLDGQYKGSATRENNSVQ